MIKCDFCHGIISVISVGIDVIAAVIIGTAYFAGVFVLNVVLRKIKEQAYVCITENTGEKVAPEFIKGIQDLEISSGQGAKFRCKVKGYPAPRVLWFKDGKRIPKNDEHYMYGK